MAILIPILTGGDGTPTYNLGMAETYSWIPIANNQNRPMFARANYITNLSDLSISLSASDINIGGVEIADGKNHLLRATVIENHDIDETLSLQVVTQDLESTIDDITIGDKNSNFATIFVATSSLNVNVTNFAILTANQLVTNILLNALTASNATSTNQVITNTLLNSVTANQATTANQIVTNTLLNAVTANQLSQITLANALTAKSNIATITNWDVLSAAINSSTYTTLPSNLANEITILNNTGGTIYIKNASKSIGLPIDNNTSFDIKLVGNTSEVAVLASSNNRTVYGTFVAYN